MNWNSALGWRRALAVAISLLALAPARAQESKPASTATFSVQTQLVQVYMTVTEGERRVLNLNASDFRLAEDGKPAVIDRLDSQTVPLQVALLFDVSGSMRDALPTTQEAAVSFIESLRPEDRASLVLFNSDIRCVPQLSNDRSPVINAIRNSNAQGGTKFNDAVLFAMKYLDGKPGRKAIVCFTDGDDTARTSSLNIVMSAAGFYGFPVYAIGAGEALSLSDLQQTLRKLAAVNSGKAYFVDDLRKLREMFARVAAELRSAYVLNYYTQVASDGKWHDLEIRAVASGYKIHARRGFFAGSGNAGTLLAEQIDNSDGRGNRGRQASAANPAQEKVAQAANAELLQPSVPIRPLDAAALQTAGQSESPHSDEERAQAPVYRVESRLVEVPVLVESLSGKALPALSEKDFRIYEDDSPREIAYFADGVRYEDLGKLRTSALHTVQASDPNVVLARRSTDEFLLGRYYLVVDDMISDTGAFLRAKAAAEQIIRQYQSRVRPITVHFTSESQVDLTASEDTETMLKRLRQASQKAPRQLTSKDDFMSVYDAYLVERGDRDAEQLAELRYASNMLLSHRNGLGEVVGEQPGDEGMIRGSVETAAATLMAQNAAQTARVIDGLKSAVEGLSSYPGNYPKVIIVISTGFVLGRGSRRGDMASMMEDVIKAAKRKSIRIFTVDAGGLAVNEALGIGAKADFLVRNPHLESLLHSHASGWQFEKENSLSQPAAETGGKFVHNTNDLVEAAGAAMRSTGELYYLGYLSRQRSDGRFHRIRVATSLGGAVRVTARRGYFAGQQDVPMELANAGEEPVSAILARVDQARKSKDMQALVRTLDELSRKMPEQADVWFNFGSAALAANDPSRAVSALQRASELAPDDKGVGFQLSRALFASGQHEAAAETLVSIVRRDPNDALVLVALGRIYEADSRLAEAHETYRKVLDLNIVPPPEVDLLLARTAFALGRRTEAELCLEDYLARGGDPAKAAAVRSLQK